MKTHEMMTTDVVAVSPETKVREIARIMSEKRVSGIPVLDAGGKLVGIVSHSDLLHRHETGTERQRRRWLDFLADPDSMAREFSKSHGMKARDVMTARVATIGPLSDLREAADLMEKKGVKRLPVVLDGQLVGILTRGDIVAALTRLPAENASVAVEDATLERELRTHLASLTWLDANYIAISVKDGVASLNGLARSDAQRAAIETAVEEVAGVKTVENGIRVRQNVTMVY